jgi:hypothetical protein
MILLNKRNFTNILCEVYNLIKSPLRGALGIIIDFILTNTQFQYKQTLLYSVDPLCLLLRLGNKQTFSFKNRKLLRVI